MSSLDSSTTDPDALAAQWLVRILSPDLTSAELTAVTDWLNASPLNREAFERAEGAWEASANLTHDDMAAHVAIDEVLRRRARRPAITRFTSPVWLAAGLLCAASVTAAVIALPSSKQDSPSHGVLYATSKGVHSQVRLADGSLVALNSNTRVRVSLTPTSRSLVLDQGELSVRAVHLPDRPLTVTAGDIIVRDIGTRFDISRDKEAVYVAVAEGQVDVATRQSPSAKTSLSAGQEVDYREKEASLVRSNVAPERAFEWETGRAIYRDMPLSAVVKDLNRFCDKPLAVDAKAGQLRLTAVVMLDSEDGIVHSLKAFMPIETVTTSSSIELREKP